MKIWAVTDDRLPNAELAPVLLKIALYADRIILREKSKTDREITELIHQLLHDGVDREKIIVHGRADIAAVCDVQRIQVPGHGIPVQALSASFPDKSFGCSVHGLEEAVSAWRQGAKWLVYGHLFETNSKQGLPPRGMDELTAICAAVEIPVIGIGGIQPVHVPLLHSIGVEGIAVMSSIFQQADPVEAIRQYRNFAEGSTIQGGEPNEISRY